MSIHGLPIVYVLNINLISKTFVFKLILDIYLINRTADLKVKK